MEKFTATAASLMVPEEAMRRFFKRASSELVLPGMLYFMPLSIICHVCVDCLCFLCKPNEVFSET